MMWTTTTSCILQGSVAMAILALGRPFVILDNTYISTRRSQWSSASQHPMILSTRYPSWRRFHGSYAAAGRVHMATRTYSTQSAFDMPEEHHHHHPVTGDSPTNAAEYEIDADDEDEFVLDGHDDDENNNNFSLRSDVDSHNIIVRDERFDTGISLTPMSDVRRKRLEEEHERDLRFVRGDELQLLRQQVMSLRQELDESRRLRAMRRVRALEQAIQSAQHADAEFVYQASRHRALAAQQMGQHDLAAQYRRQALMARSALPQFQLAGLWVGKYGDRFEMINVTYYQDVLVAYKVTAGGSVPRGEVSFTVDLSVDGLLDTAASSSSSTPHRSNSNNNNKLLEPIELNPDAAQQWGSKYLERFAGQGQVASANYENAQYIDGQLILVGQKYFSFAWLPIGQQVFFGRPSPELTLRLLRESNTTTASTDGNQQEKALDYLARCMEETELLEDDLEASDGIFRSHEQQFYYDQEGFFE